ncbi:23S rRNA (guanosine(2251)-2'-O)-methyltransferase RlmB [candidate division KSB1 bacterium]
MSAFIYGRNTILEAVLQGIHLKKVYISSTLKNRDSLMETIREAFPEISINITDKRSVDRLARGGRSGGVCAELATPHLITSATAFIQQVKKKSEKPMVIAVDSLQDPYNFGAIIRSAVAAGFHGILFPKDRQVGITGVVASASAGACFKAVLCQTVNLARALDMFKKADFWIYGAESSSGSPVFDTEFSFPLVLIIGSEGKGIRPLVKKKCDRFISVPIKNGVESLNASVAAGIIMFEIARKHQDFVK